MQQQLFRTAFPNQNEIFYRHFNNAAENASVMAKLLHEAVHSNEEQKPQYANINRLRAKSQEINHQIFVDSGKSLISPFDRSDMIALVSALDIVAGYINISSRRINLYLPKAITAPIRELSGLIVELCEELEKCVKVINSMKNSQVITDCINSIKALEHYADKVYNKAVAALLIEESDAIELIKYNEILHALEVTTDKCEHVTTVIEAIVVKNS